jgi:hypothetical protein
MCVKDLMAACGTFGGSENSERWGLVDGSEVIEHIP